MTLLSFWNQNLQLLSLSSSYSLSLSHSSFSDIFFFIQYNTGL